jgi:hypothetical protein
MVPKIFVDLVVLRGLRDLLDTTNTKKAQRTRRISKISSQKNTAKPYKISTIKLKEYIILLTAQGLLFWLFLRINCLGRSIRWDLVINAKRILKPESGPSWLPVRGVLIGIIFVAGG